MKKKLINYIEENKNELFDILCHLLSVNTENNGSYGNEREIAEYMNAEFSRLRVESQVYSPDDVEGLKSHPDYLAGRNLEMRYNVTARLKGKDSQKSLMLAGHIDTVPVGDLSLWTVPPVQGTIKDGRIYGRGANDDKFALAVELFLVRAVKKLGIEFKNDIYLSGYVDEEYGGGDGALACCVKYPCDFYLNMDSDYMDIIHCGVGGQRLAVNLVYPGPKDACDDMIEAIYFAKKEIDKFGDRRKTEMAKNLYFKDTDIPQKALRYMNVATGLNTNDRNRGVVDFAFYTESPWDQIKKEYDELFDSINKALSPMGIYIGSVTYRSRFFRYAVSDKDHECIKYIQKASERVFGRKQKICGMCLSDLNIFINNSGGNAVSCGVCRNFDDEGGAHQPDEFVDCRELVDFAKLVAEFIFEWDK